MFPTHRYSGVVLQYLEEKNVHAVVVVPDRRRSWFPRLEQAAIRAQSIIEPEESHHCFRMHHQRGREAYMFRHWGMRAVEVDFRDKHGRMQTSSTNTPNCFSVSFVLCLTGNDLTTDSSTSVGTTDDRAE